MKKGQISLDLLVALLAAIITVSAISGIMLTYSEAQERSTAQQQLQYTATKTASIITASQALSDTNFSVELRIGKIFYTDENKQYISEYPSMGFIDNNTISVSINIKGQAQYENANFYAGAGTNIDANKVATEGLVVIRYAK